MMKLKKKNNKLMSVQAYDCICINRAGCSCSACISACSGSGYLANDIYASTSGVSYNNTNYNADAMFH